MGLRNCNYICYLFCVVKRCECLFVVAIHFAKCIIRGNESNFILSTRNMPISLPGEKKEVAKYAEAIDRTPRFLLPNVSNAPKYCSTNFGAEYEDGHQRVKFCKGTTTLAFKYQGGVIVSVDSRATQGQFIGRKRVEQMNP